VIITIINSFKLLTIMRISNSGTLTSKWKVCALVSLALASTLGVQGQYAYESLRNKPMKSPFGKGPTMA
jgi:hypothetical protein